MPNRNRRSAAQKGRSPGKAPGKPRGSPNNVPTVVADPKFQLTVVLVDESDDKLPYTGDVLYKHICAAVARQLKSHEPTPYELTAAELEEWHAKFFSMFTFLVIHSAECWGNPYVDTDKGSSTRFHLALFPTNSGVSPTPPAVIDSAAGASDRPYGRRHGGKLFFANQSILTQKALGLVSADVTHLHVSIW